MEMNLKNPWVYEELAKPENNTHLTDELIDKILAFPHDALRQDLEQIIRYHISLGCDDIPDEYDNETFDGSLFNAQRFYITNNIVKPLVLIIKIVYPLKIVCYKSAMVIVVRQ